MANGFACARCGWQQMDHPGECPNPNRLTEAEISERFQLKKGYQYALFGSKHNECLGYTPSDEEKATEARQEEEGDWFGQAVASRVD